MIESQTKIMMLDTETTNSLEDPICYDVGYIIFDLSGNIYEEASLVNSDIFLDKDFMETAFYKEKIPDYWRDIWDKKRKLMSWKDIKGTIWDAVRRHNIVIIAAHNARFDYRSLHLTQRYITTSRWRWVLPWGVEWYDTLKMCREIFKGDKNYRSWCEKNNYITKNSQPRMTAEIVYRYITGDETFEEAHTGLEDTKIEMEIFRYCMDKMPDLDGRLWPPEED